MLGGDNMDLALAHLVESRWLAAQATLRACPPARLSQLIERCRAAKEQLLGAECARVQRRSRCSARARGSIGGSALGRSSRATRSSVIVDGFFPTVSTRAGRPEPRARRHRRIRPAVCERSGHHAPPRRLPAPARGRARARRSAARRRRRRRSPVPDTLLLNGGVFRAAALARRLADTLVRLARRSRQRAAQRRPRRRRRARRGRLCACARGPGAGSAAARRAATSCCSTTTRRRRLRARLPAAARHGRRPARSPSRRPQLRAAPRRAGALPPGLVERRRDARTAAGELPTSRPHRAISCACRRSPPSCDPRGANARPDAARRRCSWRPR